MCSDVKREMEEERLEVDCAAVEGDLRHETLRMLLQYRHIGEL